MKKIFAILAIAFVTASGIFAQSILDSISDAVTGFDVGTVRGTWIDDRYDANWTFTQNEVILSYASTGEVIFRFNKDNTEKFRIAPESVAGMGEGVAIRFNCPATHRKYMFFKSADFNSNLHIEFQPDWRKEPYKSIFRFVKGEAD